MSLRWSVALVVLMALSWAGALEALCRVSESAAWWLFVLVAIALTAWTASLLHRHWAAYVD